MGTWIMSHTLIVKNNDTIRLSMQKYGGWRIWKRELVAKSQTPLLESKLLDLGF